MQTKIASTEFSAMFKQLIALIYLFLRTRIGDLIFALLYVESPSAEVTERYVELTANIHDKT